MLDWLECAPTERFIYGWVNTHTCCHVEGSTNHSTATKYCECTHRDSHCVHFIWGQAATIMTIRPFLVVIQLHNWIAENDVFAWTTPQHIFAFDSNQHLYFKTSAQRFVWLQYILMHTWLSHEFKAQTDCVTDNLVNSAHMQSKTIWSHFGNFWAQWLPLT